MDQPVSLVLPREIKYDSLPALPECQSQQVVVTPSNGNSFVASQLVQFDLPSRGYLDPSSLYLRYKLTTTNTSGNQVADIQIKGTPAYSFISKLETLFGSSVVETINQYNQITNMWCNLQMDVAMKYGLQTAYGYGYTDATAMANLDGSDKFTLAAGASTTYTYAIPLPCLLSQAEKLIPLALMPNVRIQLTLESIANIYSVLTAATGTYTITNIELCYSMIDFSAEVNNIVQQSFGEQFFIKTSSFQNMATNLSTAFSGSTELVYNMRLASIKSLFAIMSGNTANICVNGLFDSFDLTNSNGEYSFSVASSYYPQRPISTLNSKAAVLMELKRAVASVHSDNFNTSINKVEFGRVDNTASTIEQPAKFYVGGQSLCPQKRT